MKKMFSKNWLVFSLLMLFTTLSSSAQNVTGIWKGYFVSDGGEYYKLEFQVNQTSTYGVSGVSYSYLDVRFYGKATMTGTFTKETSTFRIREIKTVEVKSSIGGATCIMNYDFKYSKSGKEEFLEGTYLGKYEGKYALANGKWGDCGGGKVYLRKVTETDFYLEPFLRNKPKTNNKPVIINQPPVKKDTAKAKVNVPPAKKPVVVNKPPVVTKKPETTPKPVAKTNTPKKDTAIKKITPPITKVNPPVVTPKPAVLKNRTNELVKTLVVTSEDVTVKLYDNGEIDDDTISVYYDNKLMLSSKRLTAAPLIVKLKMENDNSDHELVMVAENLGRIPPNTSLMIVESGGQRFDVRITSTQQKNAVVRFKFQPGSN